MNDTKATLAKMTELTLLNRYRGALLGLACGDALGTTLEFKPPGTFEPLTDIVGGGPFSLKPGDFTDDTSMALCLAESLVSCGGFDPIDQMTRYCRWWQEGYLSATGKCFDIGVTVSRALRSYLRSGNPFAGSADPNTAGNGSLMRLAPIPLAYRANPEQVLWFAAESSRTTHGAQTCLDACKLYAAMILAALNGCSKDEILSPALYHGSLVPEIREIAAGSYKQKNPPEIAGTGYVVRSLEAALWAFYRSDSFAKGALLAANLGDDADTTAAIFGQLGGAFYGASGIPQPWLKKLAMRQFIEQLADDLLALSQNETAASAT
jgi:ADP-ribosyl-[dinitrogen reductase] hydrolase